jgi:hypothetical protein
MDPVAPQGLRLIRRLGEGGMGVVFEAEDVTRNERVAVKTLQRCDGATLLRFKNEFRSFKDLVHPNLVSLYELLESQGQWFLVMELLTGKSLSIALRGEEPAQLRPPTATPAQAMSAAEDATATVTVRELRALQLELAKDPSPPPVLARPLEDLGAARAAFAQLATAIDAIHRSGQLHRDIKPSNAMLEPDGRVVLLDFGVAMALQLALKGQFESDTVVGTPAYMAPELLRGAAPSRASDWYAFGVMMHDIIVGRRAYRGPVQQIFRDKLTGVRPKRADLTTLMPPALADLVDALLSEDPEQRPGYAQVMEVLEAKGAHAPAPAPVAHGLVGRANELKALFEVAQGAKSAPRALEVKGRSGVGKSALLEESLQQLEREGAVVLGGRCYAHESVPHKSVDRIVDALADLLGRRPELKERIKPSSVDELVRAFPVLRDVWGLGREAGPGPQDFAVAQRRVQNALTDVLKQLARETSLVCFVDDLQWGDPESVAVLAALTEPGSPPVLVIVSFREEEAGNAAVRAYERAVQHQAPGPAQLKVERLSDEDCATLAQRVAAEAQVTDASVIAWARAESGGEPYFLHELLFFAGGQGSEGRGVKGLTLQHVLQKRSERLSAEGLSLLRTVALSVSGVPVSIAEAASTVGHARRVLAELKAAHLVRTSDAGQRELVDTFHDKVREVISAACPASTTEALHFALYQAWKKSAGRESDRVFATAHHGPRAGAALDAAELRSVLLKAAGLAEETFNLEAIRDTLKHVRALATPAEPFGPALALRLGRACLPLGDVEEAAKSFEGVLGATRDAALRAEARYGLARLKLSQLDTPGSLEELNQALGELGAPVLRASPVALLGSLFGWMGAWLKNRLFGSKSGDRGTDGLLVNLYQAGAYCAYFMLDTRLYVQGILRAYPAVRRLGRGREVAYWYGTAAIIAGVLGRQGLRQTLDDAAVTVGKASSDPVVPALAETTCCIATDLGDEPAKAGARAEATLAEYGRWLDNSDYFTLIAGYMWNVVMRGHPRKAREVLLRAVQRADAAGADSLLAQGHTFRCYGGTVYALLGEADEGRRWLDAYQEFVKLNSPKDIWRNVQLLSHRTLFSQLTGAGDEVMEGLFAQHAALGHKPKDYAHQLRQFFVAKCYRRLEQAVRGGGLERLDEAVRELESIARHPTLRGHVCVCAGGAAWLRKQSPDALWSEALALAETYDQPWIRAEVELLKLQRAKRSGDAAAADAAAKAARAVIDAHGLLGLLPRLEAAQR